MKTVSILILSFAFAATAFAINSPNLKDNMHLYLVLDCGRTEMGIWETLRARAIESILSLKAGDQITVITAYPSGPRLCLNTEISKDKNDIDVLVKKVATLGKDWFIRADIPDAMAFTYEFFSKDTATSHSCIVLTTGDMDNGEYAKVKQLATLFSGRKCPLILVCEHTRANRQLLVGDIELRYLDKPAITEWVSRVRPQVSMKTEPNLPNADKIAAQTPPIKIDSAKPVMSPSSKSLLESPPLEIKPNPPVQSSRATVKEIKPQAIKPVLRNEPNTSAVQILPLQPAKPESKTDNSNAIQKSKPITEQSRISAPQKSKFLHPWKWSLIAISAVLGIVISVWLCNYKTAEPVAQDDDTLVLLKLIAHIGKDRYELGSPDEIREITIGNGLGSTIFVNGEGIEPQHCRITRTPKGLFLQNCSGITITANGVPIKPKGKLLLDLPAELELTSDTHVTLVEEEINNDRRLS